MCAKLPNKKKKNKSSLVLIFFLFFCLFIQKMTRTLNWLNMKKKKNWNKRHTVCYVNYSAKLPVIAVDNNVFFRFLPIHLDAEWRMWSWFIFYDWFSIQWEWRAIGRRYPMLKISADVLIAHICSKLDSEIPSARLFLNFPNQFVEKLYRIH